jgi:putative oxidoreductase
VWIAVPAEAFGGLFLIFGFAARYVAIVLIIFTVVASFSSHAYWLIEGAQRRAQEGNFWKNMSMIGGFLIFFVAGPGRFSIDRWLAKR